MILKMRENGILYVVATPIGNLEDITFRAVRILKEVDLIAAEDTRHTRKLLNHYGIGTPLTSYFEHNKLIKGALILDKLMDGMDIALVSDAGTPGISDPGHDLIKAVTETGIRVVPVPGPSAVIAALSMSSLPTSRFAFEGFLPAREKARKDRLESLKWEPRALVFYESPKRLVSTLEDIHDTIGNRNIEVIRELTKVYEEAINGRISEILTVLREQTIRGEFVIIMEGFQEGHFKGSVIDELNKAVKSGLSMKEAIGVVSKGFGISKGEVYKESLANRRKM